MSLEATVRVDMGEFRLEASVDAPDGSTVAIVGPSGAGKTTLLRAIAGLLALDGGQVRLDGTLIDDRATGVRVPPEQRRIGYLSQHPSLFPHLDVVDNVGFGLRMAGESRSAARARAAGWLRRVGLEDRAHARPAQLSGGEARRAALARTLAPEPRLLLLDEPLVGLDRERRDAMRSLIWEELSAFDGPRVLVTHDALEAVAVADRIVVIEAGRVVQTDSPAAIAERPQSSFAAEVVGVNTLRGRQHGDAVEVGEGARVRVTAQDEGRVVVVIHPRAVSLHRQHPEGSARNVWLARVTGLDLSGDGVRVRLGGDVPLVAEVTAEAVAALELRPGVEVWASVKASEVTVLADPQPEGVRAPAS